MKILAFGEVMMRMMPSNYKTLSQTNTLEFLFTGTGINVLSGLYQMGHQVYIVTKLPDNNVGKAASAEIRKLGIHDCYICYGGNHIGIYFLEQGIGNRASQVTYLNRKDSSFCLSQISDYDFSYLDGMDALHICGISLAINENLRQITYKFIEEAKKRHVKIIFDCNYRPSLWAHQSFFAKEIYENVLKQADIVFAGLKDASLLLNKKIDPSLSHIEQIKEACRQMSHDYQIETIFGTIRNTQNHISTLNGYMYNSNQFLMSPSYELTIYDRIGAGDGFAAGAIHGYFSNMDPHLLIQYATVSGLLAHTTYGDSPIIGEDTILDFIKNGCVLLKR